MIVRKPRRELTEIARQANALVVAGSSLKATLDQDWDEPTQDEQALGVVLTALTEVERWLQTTPEGHDAPVVAFSMTAAKQVKELNRWLPLVKWFLAIPHYIVLFFLDIAAVVVVIIAWVAILFTGHYPRACSLSWRASSAGTTGSSPTRSSW